MNQNNSFDVAIVGGGACGLATLIQLVTRASPGMQVVLTEKRSSVGPGLAYSSDCAGTRVNMSATSMSMYTDDSEHFVRWLKENPSNTPASTGGDQFPPREHFGRYLKHTMREVTQQAKARGIHLSLRQTEVVDMERQSNCWLLHCTDAPAIQATNVTLALGNYMSQIYKHLDGTPLYFPNPWPNSRLSKEIPKTASVAILGSRLTAIDEALYLADHGHTGKIYLLSRTGTLLKVQAPKRHDRVYTMHNLARELEEKPQGAIITLARRLHEEINRCEATNKQGHLHPALSLTPPEDMAASFRQDVQAARDGHVPGQTIFRETALVIERYWQSLDEGSKEAFLREYFSLWSMHRHAMPLRTGERLLKLLEKGQVEVLRIDSSPKMLHSDSGFTSLLWSSTRRFLHTDALVEATGIEYDATRIDSQLMANLLSREILTANPCGGVNVDHQTLKAQSGLYVIGSMTRGVHFHSTAIDRNVPHATRLVDNILKLPPRRLLHVALFVGTDVYSNLIASQLIPKLIAAGHLPFIYSLISKDHDPELGKSFELRELDFYQRCLLQDAITPYLSMASTFSQQSTIEQLVARNGLYQKSIASAGLNDLDFRRSLTANHLDLGYVIANSETDTGFPQHVLSHFQSRLGLLRLRPVMQSRRARGFTLQTVIDEQETSHSDERIVDSHTPKTVVSPGQSLLNAFADVWELGAELLARQTETLARGIKDDAAEAESLQDTRLANLSEPSITTSSSRLVDAEGMKKLLLDWYTPEDDQGGLQRAIEDACRRFYATHNESAIQISTKPIAVADVCEAGPASNLHSSCATALDKLVPVVATNEISPQSSLYSSNGCEKEQMGKAMIRDGHHKKPGWALARRLSSWRHSWLTGNSREMSRSSGAF